MNHSDSYNVLSLITGMYVNYEAFVVVMGMMVTIFWVLYFCNELWYIKMRYKRALNEVRDFETENILLDLKSKFVKNLILLFICLFEITAPISAFITEYIHLKYCFFPFYYTIGSTYLTFCLLNILTTYLIRVYTCKLDSKKDRRALIIFFIKLTLTFLLSLLFYIIILPSLLVIFLFIREFLYFIKNGRMLDRVIGWKQQDLSLEFGSEGRVLAIKRMRRRFHLFKAVFITCTSCLVLILPIGLTIYVIRTYGMDVSDRLVYIYQPKVVREKELHIISLVLELSYDLLMFPTTLMVFIYTLFTIHFALSTTCRNIYDQVNGSLKRLSKHFTTEPLLHPQ